MSRIIFFVSLLSLWLWISGTAFAQGTAFTYQGKLTDGGNPASGLYDLQFKLFDTPTVGTGLQQGSALTLTSITVANGIFTTQLDFGACPTCFNGSARFLEIAVRLNGGSAFTTLAPRQPLSSNPYAIRSLAAAAADGLSVACVNCITSSQIQSIQGSQVTGNIAGNQISGAIPLASVPAGSTDYVQNSANPQAANFNIGGDGLVAGTLSGSTVNASTQYNIGGARVLSKTGFQNLFVGIGAGAATTGGQNAFVGFNAGLSNTTGGSNSFFGPGAGQANTTGIENSFFGFGAGILSAAANGNSFFGKNAGANNAGDGNSFFGSGAGVNNKGTVNSFVGLRTGEGNTTGSSNSFFGNAAGLNSTTGSDNTFLGVLAGSNNTTGANNTFIGANSGPPNTSTQVNNSTAIGFGASASANNTIVLGTATETTQIPGNLTVHTSSLTSNNGLTVNSGSTFNSHVIFNNIFAGDGLTLNSTSRVNADVTVFGRVTFGSLPPGTSTACFAPGFTVAVCGSSLRYKTNLRPYHSGLAIINRLNPIAFTWKQYGLRDVGLGAEDVAAVEPRLTFNNDSGQVEGVKYDRLSVVFINAFKEQQAQIAAQRREIETLKKRQRQLEALKGLICADHPTAAVCQ